MTYEERTTQAMKMTLEELLFAYHWAMDTAENQKNTIDKMVDLGEERVAQRDAARRELSEARNHVLEDILQQSRHVRSYSNPDKVFDAIPVRVIMPEATEKQEKDDE